MQMFIISVDFHRVVEENISLCYSCNFSVSLNVFQNNKKKIVLKLENLGEPLDVVYYSKSQCMYMWACIATLTFPAHIY